MRDRPPFLMPLSCLQLYKIIILHSAKGNLRNSFGVTAAIGYSTPTWNRRSTD